MDSRDAPGSSRFGGGTSEAAVSIIVARMEPFAAQSGGTEPQNPDFAASGYIRATAFSSAGLDL